MRFAFERFTQQIKEIELHIARDTYKLENWRILPEAENTNSVPEVDDPRWQPFSIGQRWGQNDDYPWAWFSRQVTIPEGWQGRDAALIILLGDPYKSVTPEALVYIDGVPHQALDHYHYTVYLDQKATPGTTCDIAIEAWRGRSYKEEQFLRAELVWLDADVNGFCYDAKTALEVARSLPEADYARTHLINALEEAFLDLDLREPLDEAYYASIRKARATLQTAIERTPLPPRHERVHAIGHAHLDVAWLWPLGQTRQKAARTFSTALRLMERYPDYHFMSSQAQLYKFVQEDYPEIYAQVQERIQEGRWEVNGATWVEMDTNITGGESLVRQFLYGRKFFQDKVGTEGDVLWLPDVFGYSGSLPQIIRRAGIRYFMTTKISWNQYNRFPYDTFDWKGIDGTSVLTHFVTTPSNSWFYTYNGALEPDTVLGTWAANRSKDVTDDILLTYGHGDGGGGPTYDMIEFGQRLQSYPGAPQVVLGPANDFFHTLEKNVEGKRLPEWEGELYLELHRGTLTSQAQNKRYNRKSEILYHQAEAACAAATLLGKVYPQNALSEGWELILLNQFHDIIPGSSIRAVYEESAEQYEHVAELGRSARDEALQAIAESIDCDETAPVVIFNSLSQERDDLVTIPAVQMPDELAGKKPCLIDLESGRNIPVQMLESGDVLAEISNVPAWGYRALGWSDTYCETSPSELHVTPQHIETPFLSIELNERGHLTSVYDKQNQRQVLAEGAEANVWQTFEDKPVAHDAWDIDIFYQDKMWVVDENVRVTVIEEGPLRAGLQIEKTYRNSRFIQRLYVYSHTPRIDFDTEVDWHEHHVLLKAAFPVDVHSARATYEIQFGALERATHWNTSWDYARFEVGAQRWADLSETGYGVSLLNDCKYGYDIKGNVMRITLIKSGTHPDPEADQGLHRFVYSLLPHTGDWTSDTINQAAMLNDPLIPVCPLGHCEQANLPTALSFAQCDAEHVIVDTIKAAEDGEGLIVRLYEAHNRRGNARLSFVMPLASVYECNLMEENETAIPFEESSFEIAIKPFQIRTFRIKMA